MQCSKCVGCCLRQNWDKQLLRNQLHSHVPFEDQSSDQNQEQENWNSCSQSQDCTLLQPPALSFSQCVRERAEVWGTHASGSHFVLPPRYIKVRCHSFLSANWFDVDCTCLTWAASHHHAAPFRQVNRAREEPVALLFSYRFTIQQGPVEEHTVLLWDTVIPVLLYNFLFELVHDLISISLE